MILYFNIRTETVASMEVKTCRELDSISVPTYLQDISNIDWHYFYTTADVDEKCAYSDVTDDIL